MFSILNLIVVAGFAVAGPGSSKGMSEGSADLIEKAHNLSLQKDRTQAVSILVTALKRENPNSTAAKELKTALHDVGGLFFGDKAQQLYELALSMRRSDPSQAQTKIGEALRIEPDNLQLLSESARLQLIKGDCASAAEALAKIRSANPYDERILLVSAQAAVCQEDWPTYASLRSQADSRKGLYAKSWMALEVERAIREGAMERAKEALDILQKADPSHPEIIFWSLQMETGRTRASLAQRYLTACKNITAANERRHMMDIAVCRRTADAETILSKAGPR